MTKRIDESLCTAVIDSEKGLMVKLLDGSLLPGVVKISLTDDLNGKAEVTVTLKVNAR
jgi:hypothetical protein